MRKTNPPNYLLHTYFLLTVIGLLQFYYTADLYIAQLFGFHTSVYGFFLALLLGDLGFSTLAGICFILWPVLVICFVISYVLAVWKHKYRLFTILVIVDLLLSVLISLRYIQAESFVNVILSISGIITSLYVLISVFRIEH